MPCHAIHDSERHKESQAKPEEEHDKNRLETKDNKTSKVEISVHDKLHDQGTTDRPSRVCAPCHFVLHFYAG